MAWQVKQRRQDHGGWLAELFNGDELVTSQANMTRRLSRREREMWTFLHREKHRRAQIAKNVAWDDAMLAAGHAAVKDFDPTKATVALVEDIEDALGRNHSWGVHRARRNNRA